MNHRSVMMSDHPEKAGWKIVDLKKSLLGDSRIVLNRSPLLDHSLQIAVYGNSDPLSIEDYFAIGSDIKGIELRL